MTVGEMLGGGARLVRTQPRALALWALLYLIAAGAMTALIWPTMMEMVAMQRQMMTGGAGAGAPPPAPPVGLFAALFLMELLLVAAMVAIFAAAVRAVARGGDDRFGFLRFGIDEIRLIGVGILLWLLQVAAMIAFAIVATLLAVALQAAFGPAAMAALLPLWLVAAAAMIWAAVRLSLVGAFTVLDGRIAFKAAWRATRGRFWTLLGAYLVIGLVYALVSLALTAILFPDLFALYAALLRQDDPGAVIAFQQGFMAQMFGPRMIVAMLVGTVVNTALVGWLFGAIATAAATLAPASRA